MKSRSSLSGLSTEFLEEGEIEGELFDTELEEVDDDALVEEGNIGALREKIGGSKAAARRRKRRLHQRAQEQAKERRLEAARREAMDAGDN